MRNFRGTSAGPALIVLPWVAPMSLATLGLAVDVRLALQRHQLDAASRQASIEPDPWPIGSGKPRIWRWWSSSVVHVWRVSLRPS